METTHTTDRPHLLVVDGEPHTAELLERWFELSGYDVSVAADGPAALTHLESRRPDAIVLDLTLPGGASLDVLRRTRALHPSLPVVLTTASDVDHELLRTAAPLAHDLRVKPYSLVDLDHSVRSLVHVSHVG